MKETVCLVSLGCPKNLVDSEVILGLLSKEGHPITIDRSKAEIIIVNTCSFIKDAAQEAIETILQLIPYKRKGRCRLLIVSGCLPQRYGRTLEEELPGWTSSSAQDPFKRFHSSSHREERERAFSPGRPFSITTRRPGSSPLLHPSLI